MRKISRCCIIDDDPIFIYGTKRIMFEMDFCDDILVYYNGQEAIEGLTEITGNSEAFPTVIFLDLNMPIMNGWEFLEDFVKIPNNIRGEVTVFIISSSIDDRDRDRVKGYEMVNNYILKPLTYKDLEIVHEAITKL